MQKIKISYKTNMFLLAILAVSLLFFSSFLFPFSPNTFVGGLHGHLANTVGISVGVPANPYNTFNQQLEDKKQELDEREKGIEDYESFLLSQADSLKIVNTVAVAGTSVSGILLALVGMNFYWDFRRNKLKLKNRQ